MSDKPETDAQTTQSDEDIAQDPAQADAAVEADDTTQAASEEAPAPAATEAAEAVEVGEARLPDATDAGPRGGGQLDILLDTSLTIAVRLGEAQVEVRELLQLGQGSVLQLDRRAGEPVDLFLRGIKFATGKLVVVGEQLGVRIEEILPSASAAEA
jgi:flagellar motor switch protein FliN/FliY